MVRLTRPKPVATQRCIALFAPPEVNLNPLINVICGASNKDVVQLSVSELTAAAALTADVTFIVCANKDEAREIIQHARHLTFMKILPEGKIDAAWNRICAEIETTIRPHGVPIHSTILQPENPLPACVALANAAQLST